MSSINKQPEIFNLGVNFKSADVSFRESLYVPDEVLADILCELKTSFGIEELCVISTCNRFEMFGVSTGEAVEDEKLYELFLSIQKNKQIDLPSLKENSFIYRNTTAAHHLISVASSLDSLVVGETQITGQFKKSIALSKDSGCLGPILDRLSQEALACSKKVRRNTAIGEKTVSISHAAIDLAKKVFGDISEQKVLIIGAGEMSRLAYKYAASYKSESLTVVNRTVEKARSLVKEADYGTAHGMDELELLLEDASIVISSTSASEYIITKSLLSKVQAKKSASTMFLCDIAIPRDIDPECRDLEEVFLFEVDDLQQVVNENIEERKIAAKDAMTYVEAATNHYIDWVQSHDIKGVLSSVKLSFDELIEKEAAKTLRKEIFADLTEAQQKALTSLHEAISSKLLAQVARSLSRTTDKDERFNILSSIKHVYQSDGESDN